MANISIERADGHPALVSKVFGIPAGEGGVRAGGRRSSLTLVIAFERRPGVARADVVTARTPSGLDVQAAIFANDLVGIPHEGSITAAVRRASGVECEKVLIEILP